MSNEYNFALFSNRRSRTRNTIWQMPLSSTLNEMIPTSISATTIEPPRSDFNGQAAQDKFVLSVLKNKQNGFFLEIGGNDPIHINNTYVLEKRYGWNGLMVEFDPSFEEAYQQHRQCHYIIQDATTVDYASLFSQYQFPNDMDYLQIDLEVSNGSTINTLKLLDETIFDNYNFATVTFEHDIYTGDFHDTRNTSREIFEKRGYYRVYGDVSNISDVSNITTPYEDWYVHPALVDMDYVKRIQKEESLIWHDIVKILDNETNAQV